jgi:hypothetical protein
VGAGAEQQVDRSRPVVPSDQQLLRLADPGRAARTPVARTRPQKWCASVSGSLGMTSTRPLGMRCTRSGPDVTDRSEIYCSGLAEPVPELEPLYGCAGAGTEEAVDGSRPVTPSVQPPLQLADPRGATRTPVASAVPQESSASVTGSLGMTRACSRLHVSEGSEIQCSGFAEPVLELEPLHGRAGDGTKKPVDGSRPVIPSYQPPLQLADLRGAARTPVASTELQQLSATRNRKRRGSPGPFRAALRAHWRGCSEWNCDGGRHDQRADPSARLPESDLHTR